MRALAALLAGAVGVALAPALDAQSVTAGGTVDLRVGYGSNPFLSLNSQGGTGVAGGTLTAWLQRQSETSTTRLTGIASIDQNFSHYGRPENYLATLRHDQSFSARLRLQGELNYQDSISAQTYNGFGSGTAVPGSLVGGDQTDLLSIGQRTRSVFGDASLQWQPTSRDSFYAGPSFNHTTYPGNGLSNFDQYGARGGYLRRINEKLQLGIDLNAQRVNSKFFPNSTSYQASGRLVYDFSAIWQFDGSIGLINQRRAGIGSRTTAGFTARLCGKYPRYRACIEAARQSSASGLGGLRTDNRIDADISYDLTSLSQISAGAIYDISDSSETSVVPKQKYWQASLTYRRTLSDRLSAGVTGNYQHRDYGALAAPVGLFGSTASGYSVTANVSYRFGRLQ